MVVDPVNQY